MFVQLHLERKSPRVKKINEQAPHHCESTYMFQCLARIHKSVQHFVGSENNFAFLFLFPSSVALLFKSLSFSFLPNGLFGMFKYLFEHIHVSWLSSKLVHAWYFHLVAPATINGFPNNLNLSFASFLCEEMADNSSSLLCASQCPWYMTSYIVILYHGYSILVMLIVWLVY